MSVRMSNHSQYLVLVPPLLLFQLLPVFSLESGNRLLRVHVKESTKGVFNCFTKWLAKGAAINIHTVVKIFIACLT